MATGFVLTNQSAPTDDPASTAPITGTTTDHTVERQYNSLNNDGPVEDGPGMLRRLPDRSGEKSSMAVVLTTNHQQPSQSPVLGVIESVETVLISDGEQSTLTPSSGLSGGMGMKRHGADIGDDDDTPGTKVMETGRMMSDVVDNLPGGAQATDEVASDVSTMNNQDEAVPSVGDRQYPGKITSKNFTANSNSCVLAVPTTDNQPVSGDTAMPGARKDDDMPRVVSEDTPTREMVTREMVTPKCSYTGRGICLIHGPGAKLRWKPRMKKVTDEEGVTRLVKLEERNYFYVCNPRPSVGKGKLKQTGISGFLTPPRVRREGNSTATDATLLGDRPATTVGQHSMGVVQYEGAGIKEKDED